jgi:coproporphyrinogen III oxidase-like Fe-S oxidoreductase
LSRRSNDATGIYVHWPYCSAICPYCDFNVYRARGADNAPLIAAISADLDAHAKRFGRREVVSLFFGGGTPSLLRGAEIEELISCCEPRLQPQRRLRDHARV